MEKIAIITDSGCDLTLEEIKENNIHLLPFRIIYKDREYLDKIDISPDELYKSLEAGDIPTTSLPDLEYTDKIIEQIKAEGYTHIIGVTVSSKLSGAYNSLRLLLEHHPEITSYLFDSKTLGFPVGAIGLKVAQFIKEGKSFNEIVETLPDVRKNTLGFVTFNTLEFIIKGGRIGRVAGAVGELLHLKPIIACDDEGLLYSFSKARGRKKSISKVKEIALSYLEKGKCRIWVLNGHSLDEAKKFFEEIKDHCNISKITLETIGAAMGVHTGPGALGICIQME